MCSAAWATSRGDSRGGAADYLPEALRYLGDLQKLLFGGVLVDPADLRMLVFGLALVLIMIFRPAGLLPSERRRREFSAEPAVLAQEQTSLYDSQR